MKLIKSILLILSLAALPAWAQPASSPATPAAEKVRLQLKWFNQFQFAGYYAAIEQGYYAAEGLDVEIAERILDKNFVQQVTSGEANFGVGDSGLLSQYAHGQPIVALAAIFQHNPLVFIARQDSGIISPYEMAGKRIMSDIISTNEAPVRAMLAGANITEKDYTLIPQSNDYDQLIRKEVDVISGYLTDQPYSFREKGLKINIINPQNYGVDFYGDILFTSKKETQDHPGRAERFRRASLKGWRYALDHPEELIQIISKKYHSKLSIDHLRFEAAETHKLILPDVIPLGQIEPNRLKMVGDSYANSGFNRPLSDAELAAFIFSDKAIGLNLTNQEAAWLATHSVIRVGIDRDFAPYEWIDQEGHYVGMAADYMHLLEKKLGVRFEIIKDKSWAETLNMAKRGELDMLSCAVKTPERAQYLTFTEPYKATQAVIIDNGQGGFIGSLDHLIGKRVAVEKGYFMQELLQKNHPQIQLVTAPTTDEALELVLNGKADAYIGDAGSANYAIKKAGLFSLRFSGQTNYSSQHSVAISKSNPELAAIIVKAMASISKDEADAIFNRWLGLRIEQGVKTETLIKYGAAMLLVFLLFAYWVYRLRMEIVVRKEMEDALHHTRDLAEHMARAKSEFLANMSHEIRTPMNGIIGLSQLALNHPTSPQVRDYLQKISSSSQSLLGILNDILDFSKLEAGRMSIDNGPFDLDLVLDNLRNLFEERAQARHLAFDIEIEEGVPRDLIGDAMRIQQILSNLLGNAIKFTAEGHVKLKVQAAKLDGAMTRLRFAIEDTGIGIAQDDIDKLFQPFSQVDGSITRRFGGTGLGLVISHDLLQLMGGEFDVTSLPGKGSTFSFELLLGVAAQGTIRETRRRARQDAGKLASKLTDLGEALKGGHILVAEDNTINQQVVKEFLTLSGMEVTIANHGQEALDLLLQHDFDAILMDVHMPFMGGVEATQKIRAQKKFISLPIIALTAGVTQEERDKCKACGMDDFIAKPVNPEALITTLSRWIKPGQALPAAPPDTPDHHRAPSVTLPGFDLGNLFKMLGGNQVRAVELLQAFSIDVARLPEEIRTKLAAGDFAGARELAHKIKGAAGNLGAGDLHAASTKLEAELKQGQADEQTRQAFETAFKLAMEAIGTLQNQEMAPQAPPGDPAALTNAAKALDRLLEESDFIPPQALDEIKANLPAGNLALFERLRKHINDIDYAEARQVLQQIIELASQGKT